MRKLVDRVSDPVPRKNRAVQTQKMAGKPEIFYLVSGGIVLFV